MTSAVRTVAMATIAILLMHVGGMALDPIAPHAPAVPETAHHAGGHHAGHGAVSTDDLATVQSAWSCIDGEGIPTSPRAPLPVTVFVAVIPVVALPVLHNEVRGPVHWAPPPLDAAQLRVLLQVFLN